MVVPLSKGSQARPTQFAQGSPENRLISASLPERVSFSTIHVASNQQSLLLLSTSFLPEYSSGSSLPICEDIDGTSTQIDGYLFCSCPRAQIYFRQDRWKPLSFVVLITSLQHSSHQSLPSCRISTLPTLLPPIPLPLVAKPRASSNSFFLESKRHIRWRRARIVGSSL